MSMLGIPTKVSLDQLAAAEVNRIVNQIQAGQSWLAGAQMGVGSNNTAADEHVVVWRTPNGALSYGGGILGPFPYAGTIDGFDLWHYGETAGGGNTVDLAIYCGAYTDADSVLISTPPNEQNKGTTGTPWALTVPATAKQLTKTYSAFASGSLSVAAGDFVSVWIYRNGSTDSYGGWWDVFGLSLVWA